MASALTQRETILKRIEELELEKQKLKDRRKANTLPGGSTISRRERGRIQVKTQEVYNEAGFLYKALAEIDKGVTYQDTNQVLDTARESGRQGRQYQLDKLDRGRANRAEREAQLTQTTTPPQVTSNKASSSLPQSKTGVYYDIDDPNAQFIRDGEDFKQIDNPVSNPQNIQPNAYRQPGTLGSRIKPRSNNRPDPLGEFGTLTVTKEESKKLSPTTPAWVVQSKTPSEAVVESAFVSQTPQKNRNINTKELYEYNRYNIRLGQGAYATYKATGKVSNSDLRRLDTESRVLAKYDYASLPIKDRAKLTVSGYGQGVSSMVIGAGEFGANMYNQLNYAYIDPKTGKTRTDIGAGRKIKFGGVAGEIRSYPGPLTTNRGFVTSTKEYVTSPQGVATTSIYAVSAYSLGKLAYTNVKTYGIAKGSTVTVGEFSPIKFKGGIYTEKPSYLNSKNVKVIKGVPYKNGLKVDYLKGTSDTGATNIKAMNIYNKKGVGFGVQQTQTQFYEIRGSMIVRQGTVQTTTPYSLGGGVPASATWKQTTNYPGYASVTKTMGPQFKGGYSYGQTGTTTRYFADATNTYDSIFRTPGKSFRTGGANIPTGQKGVSRFNVGNAEASGINQFRYNPQFSGTQYDFKTLGNTQSGGITVRTAPGPSGSTALKQTQTGGTFTTPTVKSPIYKTTPGFSGVVSTPTITKQQQRPTITTAQTQTKIIVKQEQPQSSIVETMQGPILEELQTPVSRGSSRRASYIIPTIGQLPTVNQEFTPITTPTTRQGQRQRQIQRQQLGPTTISNFGNPTVPGYPNTPVPTGAFIPPLPPGIMKGLVIGKVPGVRSQTGYTPSIKALFFKIRGPRPTGTRTGLRFRPITKGFRFTKRRKR